MDENMGFGPMGMTPDMARNSPFLSPGAIPDHSHSPHYPRNNLNSFPHGRSSGYPGGTPLVVLPVPLPANGMSGLNSGQGFQYPGSYMPPGTPLHRFNGYIVCNPPDLAVEANSGANPKRVVKITTTRSLATPGHSQPCPVYTVNGEIQKQRDYTTRTTPPIRNVP